jgi:hypothetical protein
MSLYQVSTRASRRRRIGAWLRARWIRRVGSGRHHQTGDVSSRVAHTPKVMQHAFVPPDAPTAATHADGPTTAGQTSTNGTPRVPQQRPLGRTTSVYPNAYRAR